MYLFSNIKKKSFVPLFVVVIAILLVPPAYASQLIIKLKSGVSADAMNHPSQALARPASTTYQSYLRSLSGIDRLHILELSPQENIDQVMADYAVRPDIEFVEKIQRLQLHSVIKDQENIPPTINDPFLFSTGTVSSSFEDLWGMFDIEADKIWDQTNGEGVVVAVIDSGVDIDHTDMGPVWTNEAEAQGLPNVDDDNNGFVDDIYGYDFTECYELQVIQTPDGPQYGGCQILNTPSGDITDENGHGTHVAGTINASGGNNLGVIGVAFGARVMSLKGLNKQGSGTNQNLAEAIIYAADNGADVINMSFGGSGQSQVIGTALQYAFDANVILIASAGNDNLDIEQNFYSPASFPSSIAISSLNASQNKSGFSNYGNLVSVAGPGSQILSLHSGDAPPGGAINGLYSVKSGTSMSGPHVAGIAALLKSIRKNLNTMDVKAILEQTAIDLGNPGFDGDQLGYGHGLANAYNAVMMLLADVNTPPNIELDTDNVTFSEQAYGHLSFDVQDEEQKSHQISVEFTQLPDGLVFEAGSKQLRWVPHAISKGSHDIVVNAFDGFEYTQKTFSIEIMSDKHMQSGQATSLSQIFKDGSIGGCRSDASSLLLMVLTFLLLALQRRLYCKDHQTKS